MISSQTNIPSAPPQFEPSELTELNHQRIFFELLSTSKVSLPNDTYNQGFSSDDKESLCTPKLQWSTCFTKSKLPNRYHNCIACVQTIIPLDLDESITINEALFRLNANKWKVVFNLKISPSIWVDQNLNCTYKFWSEGLIIEVLDVFHDKTQRLNYRFIIC